LPVLNLAVIGVQQRNAVAQQLQESAQQQVLRASAYAIIRKALDNAPLLSKLWPKLTDDGQHILEEAGITGSEQRDELLQILNLAVVGAQQQNVGAQQQGASPQQASAYAIFRKALDDAPLLSKFLPELTDDGRRALEEAGIPGADQQGEFRQVLNLAVIGAQQQNAAVRQVQEEISRQQLEVTKISLQQQVEFAKDSKKYLYETMAVMSTMKDGLGKTIHQIDSAFSQTMWMYAISFYLGVALIIAAIVSALYGKQLLPMVLGGLGTANTLAFFFTKPPERLQSSRASLAQLQCALLNWFNDFFNQNALMSQLSSGAKLDLAPYKALSETLMNHTEDMMSMLQKYCKLIENPLPDQNTPKNIVPTPKQEATVEASAQSDAA
jgi:hypothetical protein